MTSRPLVLGHRGNASVAPQNTLAALESAYRSGAAGTELDLRLTRDGHPVVIHDRTVDVCTDGSGAVADLTLAEVRRLDAGVRFSAAYAGQRVPTFDDVVRFFAEQPGFEMLLELKGEWTVEQVRPVVEALDAAGLGGRAVPKSFSLATVAALRDAAPHLRRGVLVEHHAPDTVRTCVELGAWTCNPSHVLLAEHPELVGALHDAGLRVMTWTPNAPEDWSRVVGLGVDAIMTDRPDRLLGWLDGGAGGAVAAGGAPQPTR
ncbi:glycerophosphodiester phosphodiesterase family protein [Cellulomonas sp. PhB143]|uniref:glycerophosphodiester phosphodiesterase n=1 Tax=Cellulomonas sp. PhB143 TaxID=2485186 RepID=UPI000F47C520|nr:glycerophosphodiester phosphodiesterase family protein [Cellulomonas sp. PhB143]ROS76550.1 glycerophosphoryl diester phosphodiesterase [Cellulomonas sp. PhB143]